MFRRILTASFVGFWPNTVALGGDFVSLDVDRLGDRASDYLLSLFVAFGLQVSSDRNDLVALG
jgi:hypothetical protein